MISIEFTPWGPFHAQKNRSGIDAWLHEIGAEAVRIFEGGMGHYPPSSSPGAWPNNRTGNLGNSIRADVGSDQVEVGTSMSYSIFLREGTWKMERRKMSDDALKEAMRKPHLGHWVEWVRG